MILVIKNYITEGPGTIAEYFDNLKIIELTKGEKLPENLTKIEAVFVMGGPMSVYDEKEYPFLKEETIFIKKVVENEIPFFGICLGAQLLAKAFNAKVYKAQKEEIGFFNITLTPEGVNDLLFYDLPETFEVFQWHSDTFELPENAKLLAISDVVKNQAFKIGKNGYGLQFHIEVNKNLLNEWFENEKFSNFNNSLNKLRIYSEKIYNNILNFIL